MLAISRKRVAQLQSGCFIGGGVWPILHLRSFEMITGPKADGWLVKTVGGLLTVVGMGILQAARRQRITPETAFIGVGTSAVLAAVDVVYVTRRRISPIYLLDAVANAAIITGWLCSQPDESRHDD